MLEWPAWLPSLLRLGVAAPAFALIVTAVVALTPDAWLDDHSRDLRTPIRPYLLLAFVASAAWSAVKAAPLGWARVKANAARKVEQREAEVAVRRLPAPCLAILEKFDQANGLPLRLQQDGDNVALLLAERLILPAGARPLDPRVFALFRPAEGVLEIFRRVRGPKPPPPQ